MSNALTTAVDSADVKGIVSLINGGADPIVDLTLKRQFRGYLLCASSNYPISKIMMPVGGPILGNNGQISKFGKYILTIAAQNNDFAITSILSQSNVTINKSGNQALLIAATKGYSDILDDLLLRNVDVNVKNFNGDTSLILATKVGSLSCVTSLVNAGSNVNLLGGGNVDALSIAISLNYNDISSFLLANGSDPNKILGGNKNSGFSAVKSNNITLLTSLIAGGLNLEQVDDSGMTMLNLASLLGRTEIVDMLILAGADLNAVDSLSRSSLINATIGNRLDAVTLLLYPSDGRTGIDISITDVLGKTALDYAEEFNKQEIGGMIEDL